MMCLWRALAIALDSLGLSSRAGMVTGSGGASWQRSVEPPPDGLLRAADLLLVINLYRELR
ncbi:hypothetical protein EYF80_021886 [Liparis tanakae]|uniref:Uncharacterized protein n=1 Tax=Liparis tanakae TaxID=230148 RepID=A0A4Z2HQ66_9TELE|nr:hypothetical protein EYF80_021886 [Liparis tanakae]